MRAVIAKGMMGFIGVCVDEGGELSKPPVRLTSRDWCSILTRPHRGQMACLSLSAYRLRTDRGQMAGFSHQETTPLNMAWSLLNR